MTCSGEPRLMPSWRRPPAITVGGAGVLGHVERVLVAHVDDGRADLDPLRAGPDRGEQRERRRELLGEVVDAVVRTVPAKGLDASASSMDWISASDAERTCEYGASDQCPNDRNAMRFTAGTPRPSPTG